MTTLVRWLSLLLLTVPLAVSYGSSCAPPRDIYQPVYLSYHDLRDAVTVTDARPINDANRILTRGDTLYVVERDVGLHVIDNGDPSAPEKLAFIEVPGARNAVAKDDHIYIDSYVDLVVIDVADVAAIEEVGRVEDALPYWRAEYFETAWTDPPDPSQGVVVDQVFVEQQVFTCSGDSFGGSACSRGGGGSASATPDTGGETSVGSLSAFFVVDDVLYLLADEELRVYSLATPTAPTLVWASLVANVPETLFALDNTLLVGGQLGVEIFDISSPTEPHYTGTFQHAWQCDPVVAQGDLAFVTLRSGQGCGGTRDELDIIDISDIANPVLLASYQLDSPNGLAIDGNLLLVTDSLRGLLVFDVSTPEQPFVSAAESGLDSLDVIAADGLAIVMRVDSIVQYAYTELGALTEISVLD